MLAGYELSGHADPNAVEGQDIICAATSVLAINTLNSLEQLLKLMVITEGEEENDGYLYVTLEIKDLQRPEVQLLLASFELGIKEIAKNYPDYLKIVK
ncbi:hypothetical protein IV53_GL000912 [Ligilactobacillus ceti DSM 22408]|uniref:Ribosomal processing cysteine protease Prp n=1 Tax=Ligilactobacillus ceti DSM 22408 TaxID=1122146 RepID=A0A0R2KHY9_9LACO|nr:hypothetical protein IV53_GL000912 [Ligilactobacillus ceti DSM 22408]